MTTAAVPNRGATIRLRTTFFDFDGNVVQPTGAVMNVVYPDSTGAEQEVQVAMTPPANPAADPKWTAYVDTRGFFPSYLFYSVHSLNATDAIPYAVGDGKVLLNANAANLVTFP
jgi:hypothetical protein